MTLPPRDRDLAVLVEATADAAEVRQRARDGVVGDAELPADRGGGQRIEHVVAARQVER